MKKLFALCLSLLVCFFLVSCENVQKDLKHTESNWLGLKRHVTVYSMDGKIIKEYKGKFKLEVENGYYAFIDDNGKEHKVPVQSTIVDEE